MDKLFSVFLAFSLCFAPHTQAQNDNNVFEMSKNLEIFSNVYRNLHTTYVDDIQPGELIKTAIDAMLSDLDPYTNYYPESDMEDVKMQLLGQYGGIGALVQQQNKAIIISEPYENMPAHKAGLQAGDIIEEVNGETTKGKTSEEVTEKMRGQAGTELKLKVRRGDQLLIKILKREEIKLPNVPYYGILPIFDGNAPKQSESKVGYIKLNEFTQNAGNNVLRAFQELKGKHHDMKGIVIDLRGNGGGLLQEAVNIVNIFVPKGEVIVKTKSKVGNRNETFRTMNQPTDLKIPIVVLVDPVSASASEIVAGALQDLDRAVIMGTRTFGKGLVQNIIPLKYNTQMKITVAKYYIPSGRCIQAIDYNHRDEEGRPTKVPDSLKTAFKTKNGRTVYDGFGIEPDIELAPVMPAPITISLFTKFHIFNFANIFSQKHKSIPPAKDFTISDDIYSQFKEYLKDKEYEYTTATEKMLEKMRNAAEMEKYDLVLEQNFKDLKRKIQEEKKEDLDKFRTEIQELLKSEILSRYYYQKGRIEGSLIDDPLLSKAVHLIYNQTEYEKLLTSPN